jgi:hypothetical protein
MPSPVDQSLMSQGGPGVPGGDVMMPLGGPVPGGVDPDPFKPAEFLPAGEEGEVAVEIGALKAGASEVLDEDDGPSILLSNLEESGDMTKLGDASGLDPAELDGGVVFEDDWEENT